MSHWPHRLTFYFYFLFFWLRASHRERIRVGSDRRLKAVSSRQQSFRRSTNVTVTHCPPSTTAHPHPHTPPFLSPPLVCFCSPLGLRLRLLGLLVASSLSTSLVFSHPAACTSPLVVLVFPIPRPHLRLRLRRARKPILAFSSSQARAPDILPRFASSSPDESSPPGSKSASVRRCDEARPGCSQFPAEASKT